MSSEEISKKDLLELTGISYGQLYRWKRKDLIPEEWFIRKSTYTGQETFFPKEKILERVEKIQTMKENLSLDELADMFSPSGEMYSFKKEDIIKQNLVSETVVNFYLEQIKAPKENFDFPFVLGMYILEKLLQSGNINLEEGKMVIQLFHEHYLPAKTKDLQLIVIRKLGISSCALASKKEPPYFEANTKVIATIDFLKCTEELKAKLI